MLSDALRRDAAVMCDAALAGHRAGILAAVRAASRRSRVDRRQRASIGCIGPPRGIGEELRRDAARARPCASTWRSPRTRTAAIVLALARPGLTVVDAGRRSATRCAASDRRAREVSSLRVSSLITTRLQISELRVCDVLKRWGFERWGSLPRCRPPISPSRLGQQALVWQAIARGEDVRPLVPTLPEERFDRRSIWSGRSRGSSRCRSC